MHIRTHTHILTHSHTQTPTAAKHTTAAAAAVTQQCAFKIIYIRRRAGVRRRGHIVEEGTKMFSVFSTPSIMYFSRVLIFQLTYAIRASRVPCA